MEESIWYTERKVKWVRMGAIERIETILSTLAKGPHTRYQLYRRISGCAYQSLDRALKECLERGLIKADREVRMGAERRVYKLTEKGLKAVQLLTR